MRVFLLLAILVHLAAPAGAQDGAKALAQAVENRIKRGDAFVKRKEYDRALVEFNAALKLNPDHPPAFYGRGVAKQGAGDYDGAIADYDKAIELDPRYGRALYSRAAIRQWKTDHAGAIADLTVALDVYPNWIAAYVKRGESRRQVVDYAGAAADYIRAIELDPQNRAAYMARAKINEEMDDFLGATETYTALLKFAADWAPAYRARGRAWALARQHSAAEMDFKRARELDPKDFETLVVRGRMRMLAGNYEGAIADCDAAVKLAPKDSRPYFTRALVLYNFGHYRKARNECRKAIKRVTYEPDYLQLYLCLTQLRLKKRDDAIADLKAYYAGKQKKPEPWYSQVVRFLTGEIGEKEFLRSAKDETPKKTRERRCEAYFYAGTLRAIAGDEKRARRLYKRCRATGVCDFIEYESAIVELKR